MKCEQRNEAREMLGRAWTEATVELRTAERQEFQPLMNTNERKNGRKRWNHQRLSAFSSSQNRHAAVSTSFRAALQKIQEGVS